MTQNDTRLGNVPLLSDQGGLRHFDHGAHFLQLWANMCILETSGGVVLFDVGFEFNGPRLVKELRAITDLPVRYIVYGHGHADHAFGAGAVVGDAAERGFPRPVIIAHEDLPQRFDRYRELRAYHERINRIQFGIPDNLPAFPKNYLYPDLTYRDALSLSIGGETFHLRHARGETDDTTWLWCPDKKTVCVSDLWVWSCPNIGNPFKVQRYELEWANALEQIAAREPELLLPGHGPAIEGKKQIQDACLTVARALRHLRGQVVAMLNQGMWQEDILNNFEWPDEFAKSPWLAPIYGHPYFIVQGILRRYHGWYDGNPSHLFPAPARDAAREIAALAGGADKIIARVRELAQAGQTQTALHLIDVAIDSAPEPHPEAPADALAQKVELLEDLAAREPSLIARNIFLAGVRQVKKKIAEKNS